MDGAIDLRLSFGGVIIYWRGPSPYHFVRVPDELALELRAIAPLVTYGWGVVPVGVRLGGSVWRTSLMPKDGGYLVPIRDAVRRTERLAPGDPVDLEVEIRA